GFSAYCLRNKSILEKKFKFYFLDIEDIDITDLKSVKATIKKYNPNVIVNLVAFTDVATSEKYRNDLTALPWVLNVKSVINLGNICVTHDIHLIHFSTDFVFSGLETNKGPYLEDANICLDP